MSNPESFIDEVTEELRRDRLFAALRKYAWVGISAALLIVGGVGYSQYARHQRTITAQQFGDDIQAALAPDDAADRQNALSKIPAQGEQAALIDLLIAGQAEGQPQTAIDALTKLSQDQAVPAYWRDMAVLRLTVLQQGSLSTAQRRAMLEPVAVPGRAMRPLALEQLAYLLQEEGKVSEAIAALEQLRADQQTPAGIRTRAENMITAMGGTPDQG